MEDASVANHDPALKTLKACLKTATTSAAKAACRQAYADSEGATTEGGKVFVTPDGEAQFVTDGGKVFHGGKVF